MLNTIGDRSFKLPKHVYQTIRSCRSTDIQTCRLKLTGVQCFRDRFQCTHAQTQVLRWPDARQGHQFRMYGSSTGNDESKEQRVQRKLKDFKELLDDPDSGWINSKDARIKFGLTKDDLEDIKTDKCIVKESPYHYHEDRKALIQFRLADVVRLAKQKLGEDEIMAHYYRYCLLKNRSGERVFGISSRRKLPASKPYWYSGPSTETVEGRESVRQGLISNSAICLIKGSVWIYTGSHAVFADLMHSASDVANYLYRILQLSRSMQKSDVRHPYGYAPLRYITADRSFVILGGLGCAIPLVHSVTELSHLCSTGASASLAPDMYLAPAFVFVISAALEGLAMRTAYSEIICQSKAALSPEELAAPTSEWRLCAAYIRDGVDIMSVATFCESASGVVGAIVGLTGLGLSWCFEMAIFDVGASIVMASSVGAVSGFLLHRSGEALLGRTLPMKRVELIVERLEERATIFAVYDVKTEVVGTDTVRFKAEVHFNSEAITECILGIGRAPKRLSLYSLSEASGARPALGLEAMPQRLQTQAVEMFPKLQEGLKTRLEAENWLHANNALFYEALALELNFVERQIRLDLEDFKNIHIDLEPW